MTQAPYDEGSLPGFAPGGFPSGSVVKKMLDSDVPVISLLAIQTSVGGTEPSRNANQS